MKDCWIVCNGQLSGQCSRSNESSQFPLFLFHVSLSKECLAIKISISSPSLTFFLSFKPTIFFLILLHPFKGNLPISFHDGKMWIFGAKKQFIVLKVTTSFVPLVDGLLPVCTGYNLQFFTDWERKSLSLSYFLVSISSKFWEESIKKERKGVGDDKNGSEINGVYFQERTDWQWDSIIHLFPSLTLPLYLPLYIFVLFCSNKTTNGSTHLLGLTFSFMTKFLSPSYPFSLAFLYPLFSQKSLLCIHSYLLLFTFLFLSLSLCHPMPQMAIYSSNPEMFFLTLFCLPISSPPS